MKVVAWFWRGMTHVLHELQVLVPETLSPGPQTLNPMP